MDVYDYEKEFYEDLAHGKARCDGIRRAIDAALELHDVYNALTLYFEFIGEDSFEGDGFESVIVFPEYLALFEKHPEYQEKKSEQMLWAYKWVAGGLDSFYQISLEKLEEINNSYVQFCTRFGYNKHSYYRHMWNVLYDNGIKSIADVYDVVDCHNKEMKCPIDRMSEMPAGECDDEVKYILFVEQDIDKALKKAEPILSGKLKCKVVPHYTYVNFAIYYFTHGDLENARIYAEKAAQVINWDFGYNSSLLYYKGWSILILSYINIHRALKMFSEQFNFCYRSKCGRDSFYFYLGGYHLMLQLEKSGKEKLRFSFPDKNEAIYNESGIYFVSELKNYMYLKAKFYADKFDERNCNDKYNSELETKYEL